MQMKWGNQAGMEKAVEYQRAERGKGKSGAVWESKGKSRAVVGPAKERIESVRRRAEQSAPNGGLIQISLGVKSGSRGGKEKKDRERGGETKESLYTGWLVGLLRVVAIAAAASCGQRFRGRRGVG